MDLSAHIEPDQVVAQVLGAKADTAWIGHTPCLDRAELGRAKHLDPAEKPHVTLHVTPVGKARRVRDGLRNSRKREHVS